jgi:hypothetical protein
VKRISLIIMVLGTALALAPAASAMYLGDGSGGGVGSGTVPATVTDGWMSSLTLTPTPVILHTDVLGGDGSASTRDVSAATDGDSFAWSAATIGAVTLAGVLLLVLATAEVTRRRHRLSF